MLERRRRPEEKRESFWPMHTFLTAMVVLIVFTVLLLLAVFFPIPHESIARPADTSYVARPEWYFLFLMQILQFFPGELEVVGAVVLPGVAVLVLLALPFFDRSPAMRPLKRPVATSMVMLIFIGILFLTAKGMLSIPPSVTERAALIELGDEIYHKQDCSSCHTINGVGSPVGPDLAGIAERRTLSWIHQYLEDPLLVKTDSAMPGYLGALTHEEIEAISLYLMNIKRVPMEAEVMPSSGETAPARPAATGPPSVPHILQGRSACLSCHEMGVGTATKIPANHSGRSNNTCLSCHKAEQ